MEYVLITWAPTDWNVFENCIRSLRSHSTCCIVVFGYNIPDDKKAYFENKYTVCWVDVPEEQMVNRRAACKVETLCDYCQDLDEDDTVIAADADLIFIRNPFTAFYQYENFDVGLTERGYEHWAPVNGGMMFFKINRYVKKFLAYHKSEVLNPTWSEYILFRESRGHKRFGLDWSVGQDFLIVVFKNQDYVEREFGVSIRILGCGYNLCPAVDEIGYDKARDIILDAFRHQTAFVLHLKSELKQMIYDGSFGGSVVINFKKFDILKWKNVGSAFDKKSKTSNIKDNRRYF